MASREGFSQVAGDSVAISLSLLAVSLPCGAACAFDRMGTSDRIPKGSALGRFILALYLSSIYVDAGFNKLISPMWYSGLGFITPIGLPSLVWTNTGWTAWCPAFLLRLVGWTIIGFELLFPLLYAWHKSRTATVLAGIAMHLGIAVLYPFPVFSGLMLAIYAGLLPERWYAPLERLDVWISTRTITSWAKRLQGNYYPTTASIKPKLAALAIMLWCVSIGIVYAPAHVFSRPIQSILPLVRHRIFAITGINGHGVFADWLFLNYRYQIRLVAADTLRGNAMPYSRNGLFDWSVRDRVWELWWKRTQAPWTPLHDSQFQLITWASVYWPPQESSIVVYIEARPQEVKMGTVDADLFSRNNAVGWRTIGTIVLSRDTRATITWANPPKDDEELLGRYLSRVLENDPH
jgi:hypothetical protein